MSVSAVADAHRLGALIAREPGKLDLGEAPLAGEPIHDLQLRRTSGGSAQHPLAPCSRLVPVTRCQQGIERERGIADPAVAVVPVALTADLLRSEEHTSELQSIMRISYAVFCLKKKNTPHTTKQAKQTITHEQDI